MRNLFLDFKIKKELKKFQKFKESYDFKLKEIEEKEDGSLFCDGICIREGKDGALLGESDSFVNSNYLLHGYKYSKVISNLFPYKFYFKGYKMGSAESVFQAFKFKSPKLQKLVFEYEALNANRIKGCAEYDWTASGKIYFLGKEMNRDSKEYEDFIDELYVSLLQNPLFVQALKNVGDRYILHSIGVEDKTKTTFTRAEFEKELNAIKDYVLSKSR